VIHFVLDNLRLEAVQQGDMGFPCFFPVLTFIQACIADGTVSGCPGEAGAAAGSLLKIPVGRQRTKRYNQ
jgi:hypothetical protein